MHVKSEGYRYGGIGTEYTRQVYTRQNIEYDYIYIIFYAHTS